MIARVSNHYLALLYLDNRAINSSFNGAGARVYGDSPIENKNITREWDVERKWRR